MKSSKVEKIIVFLEFIFVLIHISLCEYLQKISKLECLENKLEREVGQIGEGGFIEESPNLMLSYNSYLKLLGN